MCDFVYGMTVCISVGTCQVGFVSVEDIDNLECKDLDTEICICSLQQYFSTVCCFP